VASRVPSGLNATDHTAARSPLWCTWTRPWPVV